MANKNLKSIKFPGLSDTYVVPQIDSTLTQTGRPADAKATGDAISALGDSVDEEIDALKEDLSTLNSEGTVPTSEQMLSENVTVDSVPYHFRKTASDNADREELEIIGGSVAWNQFVHNITPVTKNGIEMTVNNDGSVTLNGTANSASNVTIIAASVDNGTLLSNHVYFIKTCPKTTGAGTDFYGGIAGLQIDKDGNGGLYKHTNSFTSSGIRIDFYEGAVFNNVKVYPQYIDLTQALTPTIADHIYALEQANAGAGVALFRSLFPKDYYAYDAGSIQSVSGLSEHITTGFNQWDEEWEAYSDNQIKGKNRIKLISGATYYAKTPSMGVILYFKAQKSDSENVGQIAVINNTFVVPANANYAVLYTNVNYGTTYKNDICINLSDPAKNGTYEPYDGHSYALDDSLTLRGVPTLVDGKIKWDGDLYSPSGKVTRRFGIVDLGTLNWTRAAFVVESESAYTFYAADIGIKKDYNNSNLAPMICSKYLTVSYYVASSTYKDLLDTDKSIAFGYNSGNRLNVRDDSYTDAATFKAAMSGVYLVYEKDTPTTEQADPYVSPQICDPNGTEEFVSTGIVPVGHVTKYTDNLRMKLDNLPWNFARLIAPVEKTFKATQPYDAGRRLIINNVLYKVTASIANGANIVVGTNVAETNIDELLAELAQ